MTFYEEIEAVKDVKISQDVPMSKYTTYKVGGKVKYFLQPRTIDAFVACAKIARSHQLEYCVIGKGSNVLFSDQPYDGVLFQLDHLNALEIDGDKIYVEAGYSMMKLALKTAKLGLSGLEFASGIPGAVGGSVYMNAGAYKHEMKDVVDEVLVLRPDLSLRWYSNQEMDFTYRHSMLQSHHNYICLAVKMSLSPGNPEEILELIQTRKKRRLETQPLDKPSAGSVFRNPLPDYSWQLIDECGLRGFKIGGAMISEKHSNFIVNVDNASAADIKEIIDYVRHTVLEKASIELEVEQEFKNWK